MSIIEHAAHNAIVATVELYSGIVAGQAKRIQMLEEALAGLSKEQRSDGVGSRLKGVIQELIDRSATGKEVLVSIASLRAMLDIIAGHRAGLLYDPKNEAGTPSHERVRQTAQQTEPHQRGSQKTVGAGRILQGDQEGPSEVGGPK